MFRSAVIALTLCLATSTAQAASFTPLVNLPGNGELSRSFAVSADGAVVVGVTYSSSGHQVFRWSDGVITELGHLPSSSTGPYIGIYVYGVSADGSTVVGTIASDSKTEAFRWSNGVMTGLGDLPGGQFSSEGLAVSADGSVAVGYSSSASGNEAYRWTSDGGMIGLGDLPGGLFSSEGLAVSADGSVVVGYGSSATAGKEVFRWTSDGGMVALGARLIRGTFRDALGVSANGRVVVGRGAVVGLGDIWEDAFRWTSDGGMIGLGDLGGGSSGPNAVSDDGSVVVGTSSSYLTRAAFYWTSSGGMQSLFDVLVAQGATGLAGWTLTEATNISANGTTIVGWALDPSGKEVSFVATVIPAPPAVSLLGTALAALGGRSWLRRKATT